MKFPLKPKTPYILNNGQDQRIFSKLEKFNNKNLIPEQEKLIKLLYTQLETDWRTPLEEFIDELLKEIVNSPVLLRP